MALMLSSQFGRSSGFPILRLSGELDVASREQLRLLFDELNEAGDCLILDLSEVVFMGSAPLGLVISLHDQTARRGGALAIISTSTGLQRIFHVSGLKDLLHIFDSEPDAVEYLKSVCDQDAV